MSKAFQAIGLSIVLLASVGIGIGLAWSPPGQTAAAKGQPVTQQFVQPSGPINHIHVDVYVSLGSQVHPPDATHARQYWLADSYIFVPTGFFPPPPGSQAGTMLLVYENGQPLYDVDYETVRYRYKPVIQGGFAQSTYMP